jgi:hypothetical protein
MKIIRLPCQKEITVEIADTDTILILKEKICLQDHTIKERFTLHDQEHTLADSTHLSSLSTLLYLIYDTSDVQKPIPTISIYPSSTSPRPIVPPVPKASFRMKSHQRYADEEDDDCIII